MKTSLYILFFFMVMLVFPAQAQTPVYRGMVKVKQNKAELENGKLTLDMDFSIIGISAGRLQSFLLAPVLRNGSNSLRLQPIRINGANKQKMYQRALAFEGESAKGDVYVVLKNDPTLLQEINYRKVIPYQPWMEHAELILIGELNNYNDRPIHTYTDLLTNDLNVYPAEGINEK